MISFSAQRHYIYEFSSPLLRHSKKAKYSGITFGKHECINTVSLENSLHLIVSQGLDISTTWGSTPEGIQEDKVSTMAEGEGGREDWLGSIHELDPGQDITDAYYNTKRK